MESDVVTLQDLFVARPSQSQSAGALLEPVRPTGIRPQFVDKLKAAGVVLSPELFDPMAPDLRAVANGKAGR
jgi:pilus assembly protein CpaF